MGKVKEVVLSLGYGRREAERIEFKLQEAGVGREEEEKEQEKKEIKRKLVTKDVSEVKSSLDKGGE